MFTKSLILSRYLLPRRNCVEGSQVEAYERGFAALTHAAGAAGFWKGRVAFYAALKAFGLGPGDEIIMPAYTCLVIPAAATFLGAVPQYVDIEPNFCTLDPEKLPGALTARTRLIMIQHTYGWPSAAVGEVLAFARSKGLPVIEDCCHALGTRWQGRHVGALGQAGFFSSQWSKPYTTGLGGMLVCQDRDLHSRVLAIREEEARRPGAKTAAQLALQGICFDLFVSPPTTAVARRVYRWLGSRAFITGSTARSEYRGQRDGYFQRMSEVQAAAGLYELGNVERMAAHRRRMGEYYRTALLEAGWPAPAWPAEAEVSPLRYPVRIRNKSEALRLAERHLVEIGDWFVRPLHSHLAPQEEYGYHTGMCPEADRAAREIINLPTHGQIGPRRAAKVMRFLKAYCQPAA